MLSPFLSGCPSIVKNCCSFLGVFVHFLQQLSLFLLPSALPVKMDRARPFISEGEMCPEKEIWSNTGPLLVLMCWGVWAMVVLWLPLVVLGSKHGKGIKFRMYPEQIILGAGRTGRGDEVLCVFSSASSGDAQVVPGRRVSWVLGCKHKAGFSSPAVCSCACCHPCRGWKCILKGHGGTPGKAALRQIAFYLVPRWTCMITISNIY